jgi:hypothetical protein
VTIERWIRVFAGSFVLLSLALGAEASPIFVSRYFLWFTAFVGANLVQSAFTGFCPLANVLRFAGVKPACDGTPSPRAAPGA